MSFSAAMPRAREPHLFRVNPLAWLRGLQRECGNIVVLSEGGSAFAPTRGGVGTVAVFGPDNIHAVLSQLKVFGMPFSIAQRHTFPPVLTNLNAGLFSMTGEQHRSRQMLLAGLLRARMVDDYHPGIARGCAAFLAGWEPGTRVPLLSMMRRLALHVGDLLIFGDTGRQPTIGPLIQRYFQERREYAVERLGEGEEARASLVELGTRIDAALRERLEHFHDGTVDGAACVLRRLGAARLSTGEPLGEDELVAHGNVLFMSANEPIAVSLTWILLLLSQAPVIRRALREELAGVTVAEGKGALESLPLLRGVIHEGLRLLPPSAILVRLSTEEAQVEGHSLPSGTEVLVSPWVEHRRPDDYPEPDVFRPGRWVGVDREPFDWLPFGAGARFCVGRPVALHILRIALASLLGGSDLVLAEDQVLDWRFSVNLTPASEPVFVRREMEPGAITDSGRLTGPVSELFTIET